MPGLDRHLIRALTSVLSLQRQASRPLSFESLLVRRAACHLSVLLVKEQIVKYGAGPKCEGGSRVRYGVSG